MLRRSLIGFALGLLFIGLGVCHVRSDDRPPCNGKTPNGAQLCGQGRGCNPAATPPGSCAGNTVVQGNFPQECVDGTDSEYCAAHDDVVCTATYHCQVGDPPADPFAQTPCVGGAPVIGTNGEPLESFADNILLAVACDEVQE